MVLPEATPGRALLWFLGRFVEGKGKVERDSLQFLERERERGMGLLTPTPLQYTLQELPDNPRIASLLS